MLALLVSTAYSINITVVYNVLATPFDFDASPNLLNAYVAARASILTW